jgi:DNA processing protein
MDVREILFGLHQIESIGWASIAKIIANVEELSSLPELSSEQWKLIGLKPKQIENIEQLFNKENILEWKHKYAEKEINYITIWDEDYPYLLKKISKPPWILYVKGNIHCMHQPLLSMVGTRTPTFYGKKVAMEFANSLSQHGIGIVSGLAKGIDSCAHLGALKAQGKTIAVLGSAIDHKYPIDNCKLYDQIANEGLIISEYPIETPLHPGMFPQRNRIIAGLSSGVIVVEAAHRSGSLITVDYALEENREVYAVPGPITSEKSIGTLHLIKQGCTMLTSVQELLEDLKPIFGINPILKVDSKPTLHPEEQFIFNLIKSECLTIDELVEKTYFNIGELHIHLLSLVSKKCIRQLPGFKYETTQL